LGNLRTPKRVVKVGGSLLQLADLPERLEMWLAAQPPAVTLVVAGGGRLVDTIRQQQQIWGYPDEVAHEVALQLMDVNARQLAAACPWLELEPDWCPLRELGARPIAVLECGRWAAREPAFERSWRTTSDSIAAEVARQFAADELILLKSVLPREAASPANYVDPLFTSHLAPGTTVRLVNLAQAGWPESIWPG
jgi:aspartokinase-like uncharacterized kinase